MSVPIKILIGFSFFLVFVIYLIFGPFFLYGAVKDTYFYITHRDNTVITQAKVTGIEETSDVDSGTDYNIYVSYEYDDVLYDNVYWRTVSRYREFSVDEVVNVEIFAERPDDIVDFGFMNYVGWVMPLLITIGGPVAVLIMLRDYMCKKT